MRFGLLGSLTVHDGVRDLPVRGPLARTLLAVLLLNADRPVPLDQLIDALWGEHAPATAEASLRNLVSRLRRTLDDQHGQCLRATPAGYQLTLTADELDTRLFDAAIHRARTAHERHDHATVRTETTTALDLWRGEPLADLPELADRTPRCAQWREHRLHALEWRHDAELHLGNPQALIPGLTALTAEHPLRETFHLQLIRALAATGRHAQALTAYQHLRTTLREELGTEPGPAARELHRQLLAGTTHSRPAPSQLPPTPAHFVGRETQLAHLLDALTTPTDRPAVAVLHGMAGIGKSALAVHTAHHLRDAFPDGQLFLNLHGATPGRTPLTPLAALTTLLRTLGTDPATVPDDPDAASTLLRSTLTGTRTLLVLDDAADTAQLRPLLPATPGCAVLATSRNPLPALDATHRLRLDPLTERESITLVERAAGRATADRTLLSLEQNDLTRLVHLCGRLPLALRIAAARLATHRTLPVRHLADRLTHPHDRLDELELDDLSIRQSLALTHHALRDSPRPTDRRAADTLLAIGALDLPSYSAPQLAGILHLTPAQTATALERLTEAALLDEIRPHHYAPHDLVRDYARELPDPEQRHHLTRTALHWYADLTVDITFALNPSSIALRQLPPPKSDTALDREEALALGDAEFENVLALAERMADEPDATAVLSLAARALTNYFRPRRRVQETFRLNTLVLGSARRDNDLTAEGYALSDLAGTRFDLGRNAEALELIESALTVWQRLGNQRLTLDATSKQGLLLSNLGRFTEARAVLEQTARTARTLGDFSTAAASFSALGNMVESTDPWQAIAYHRSSIEEGLKAGWPQARTTGLSNIGQAYNRIGDHAEALRYFEQTLSLPLSTLAWDARLEATKGTVKALLGLGRPEEAFTTCQELLAEISVTHDDYALGLVEHVQGLVLRALGRPAEAARAWHSALRHLSGSDRDEVAEIHELLATTRSA
ncbi:BTAD domain-containing putative transcriptional regulator [Kitasatospora sp. NPDC088134]|uniref:AfsR/SARP family transcriptional regulator n=1 Tax=Kitasatospora sp. NPDC088134 TaxID=3364071 RepID=UPI00381874DA